MSTKRTALASREKASSATVSLDYIPAECDSPAGSILSGARLRDDFAESLKSKTAETNTETCWVVS